MSAKQESVINPGEEHFHHFYCKYGECKKQKVKVLNVRDDIFYQGGKSVETYDPKIMKYMILSIGWFTDECVLK